MSGKGVVMCPSLQKGVEGADEKSKIREKRKTILDFLKVKRDLMEETE